MKKRSRVEMRAEAIRYAENGASAETRVCAICSYEFTGFGHNPEPFDGRRCCDHCNTYFVQPARVLYGKTPRFREPLGLLKAVAKLGEACARMRKITRQQVLEKVVDMEKGNGSKNLP